jgi:hypothetical protein
MSGRGRRKIGEQAIVHILVVVLPGVHEQRRHAPDDGQ